MTSNDDELGHFLKPQERESGLVLDREGNWWHEGEPVTHEGLKSALHRWIDKDEESGRYIIRAGHQWCFIDVEDAPYRVLGVVFQGEPEKGAVIIRLSDGTEEELDYRSLRQSARNVLYADVKEGRFTARFSRNASFRLAERVEIVDDRPLLSARGKLWTVDERAAGCVESPALRQEDD